MESREAFASTFFFLAQIHFFHLEQYGGSTGSALTTKPFQNVEV